MFYLILFSAFALIMFIYLIAKQINRKRKKKFHLRTIKFIKFLVVLYSLICLITILLPDVGYLNLLKGGDENIKFTILKWFSCVNFCVLPVSVFYKNRTVRNVACYFCLVVVILNTIFLPTYLEHFTKMTYTGLNSINFIPTEVKEFLINETFRTVLCGVTWGLELLIICMNGIEQKHIFNFKDFKEYVYFLFGLIAINVVSIPIYAPQLIFGTLELKFDTWTWPHFVWFGVILIEVLLLYFVFRNKEKQIKKSVLMIITLATLLQLSQLLTLTSFSLERLPVYVAPFGVFLMLFSLMSDSKRMYDFTFFYNIISGIYYLIFPIAQGLNINHVYNIYTFFVATNVLIIPILANIIGVAPKLDRYSLKNFVLGFLIYFIVILLIGAVFNVLNVVTEESFFKVNYLYLFNKDFAVSNLKEVEKLFEISFELFETTFYPIVWLLMYLCFNMLGIIIFLVSMFIILLTGKTKKNYRK